MIYYDSQTFILALIVTRLFFSRQRRPFSKLLQYANKIFQRSSPHGNIVSERERERKRERERERERKKEKEREKERKREREKERKQNMRDVSAR